MGHYLGVHAGGLTGRVTYTGLPGGGVVRGPIYGMSAAARRACIAYLMDVDFSVPGWWFVTTSCNDAGGRFDHVRWHEDSKKLWQCLERSGAVCEIWKLELKERKSGAFVGEEMGHGHSLVLWPGVGQAEVYRRVKSAWAEVYGHESVVFVEPVDYSKGMGPLLAYLGKYIGKQAGKFVVDASTGKRIYEKCQTQTGRVWGHRGEVPRSPSGLLTISAQSWPAVISRVRLASHYRCNPSEFGRGWTAYGLELADVIHGGEIVPD